MSGPYTSYNTVPPNFEFQVEKYANPYGKIAGVGCDGTKSGVDATLPKYSSPFVGGDGYRFTNVPIGPVAGPNAPYSEIERFNNTQNYRDLFPKPFKGGKTRRMKNKTLFHHVPMFFIVFDNANTCATIHNTQH